MSRDMLAHWLDLMNQQGWIAREQVGYPTPCVYFVKRGGGRGPGSDVVRRFELPGVGSAAIRVVSMLDGESWPGEKLAGGYCHVSRAGPQG